MFRLHTSIAIFNNAFPTTSAGHSKVLAIWSFLSFPFHNISPAVSITSIIDESNEKLPPDASPVP